MMTEPNPYLHTPPQCEEQPAETPEECVPVMAPPSAGLPEVAHPATHPNTGAGYVEPLLGVAGFLLVFGLILAVAAGMRRWKENRYLKGLAKAEAEAIRNGYGALGSDWLKDRPS